MSKLNPKVLVIATSFNTRGGITSVVKAHQKGYVWIKYNCKWIETHIDKGFFFKIVYLITGFSKYLVNIRSTDLIHIHTSEPSSIIRKMLFFSVAKILNKKTIIHFHAFSPETTINSKYKLFYKYLFSKADIVVVLSDYWKKEIIKTFKLKNKIEVLYNPCLESKSECIYQKQKNILYAGTLNGRKGYKDLIKAFAKIAGMFPDWYIVFAGNGEIEDAVKIAQELKIQEQTKFIGWVNGEDKVKVYAEASIFCLPSYAEGFPMAILDAWTHGLPVITTKVGGLNDVLIDKQNALVFEPGDISGLAEAIELMICNFELRENITRMSNYLAKNVFDNKIICNQLDKIYSFALYGV